MRQLFLILFVLSTIKVSAQCNITLSGKLLDLSSKKPLSYGVIKIEGEPLGAKSDTNGDFAIKGLCQKKYHLRISHLGCTPQFIYVDIKKDTSLNFYLAHQSAMLHGIVIKGSAIEKEKEHIINENELDQKAGLSLAEISSTVSGVNILKTGANINKPIIHGLSGTRVSVINDEVQLQTQSWGNDHAPEIDPFAADYISIIKGPAALEYGINPMGGVIKMNPGHITNDPHLHGKVLYRFGGNNRLQNLALKMEQNAKLFKWRAGGSWQQSADYSSPNYVLTNTAYKQRSVFAQLEKNWNKKLSSTFYYSLFNFELGILRGAHISNLSDLENAIIADIPSFTKSNRSFDINAPRQDVTHHLAKMKTTYFINANSSINMQYAFQQNNRNEYDIRRGNRSRIPSVDLRLSSHDTKISYEKTKENQIFKCGLQYQYLGNTNNPETGILPLQPDYQLYNTGIFLNKKWEFKNKQELEIGVRQDYQLIDARVIINRKVERKEKRNLNTNLSLGFTKEWNDNTESYLQLSGVGRGPAVNELFSNGLHQGVASIEEGSENLANELGIKLLWTQHIQHKDKLQIEASVFQQFIANYIYLQPQDSFLLTIRGSFPYFKYEQNNVSISGLDVMCQYNWTHQFYTLYKSAFIYGQNTSLNIPLIYMPPINHTLQIGYTFKEIDKGKIHFSGSSLELGFQYVHEQKRLLESQDFILAPPAYSLLSAQLNTNLILGEQSFYISISGENLLNTAYRNYLNRLRYFADEMGRNIQIRIIWKF